MTDWLPPVKGLWVFGLLALHGLLMLLLAVHCFVNAWTELEDED